MGRSPCWAPRSLILTLGTSQTRTEESYKKVRYWKRKTKKQGCENQHNCTKKGKAYGLLIPITIFTFQYSLRTTADNVTKQGALWTEQALLQCWSGVRAGSHHELLGNSASLQKEKSTPDLHSERYAHTPHWGACWTWNQKTQVSGPALTLISFRGSSQPRFPYLQQEGEGS